MRPANGQGKAQPPTPRSAPRGPGDAAYYARMAWLVLVAAGCLEVVWALGLKRTEGFTKLVPSVLTLAAMAGSMYLLGIAVKTLPIGTAYAVWVGIGVVGTAIGGMVLLGEPVSTARIGLVAVLVLAILGLKITAPA